MKKILVAGLVSDKNLGDKIIVDCTSYLLRSQLTDQQTSVEELDLRKYTEALGKHFQLKRKLAEDPDRVVKLFKFNFYKYLVKSATRFYKRKIEGNSLIVVAGGGMIKFKYQSVWLYISGLIFAANKLGIPVALNAVGVEGFDDNNPKCSYLKEALNSPNVISITTRDDLKTLQEHYLKGNQRLTARLVADPAVFSASTYQVSPDQQSELIGIGLIRSNIFKDNGLLISDDELIELYANILKRLNKQGMKWKLFTNGLPDDFVMARQIHNKLGTEFLASQIDVPQTPEELLRIIAQFKGVIAARLHACILSYSLEIPVIGLVWNRKLKFFGQNIGLAERFVTVENFKADYIVEQLVAAINEGYNESEMTNFKSTVKNSIHQTINNNA